MNSAYFFGYGSLVNRATHGFDGARCARLAGWRRAWRRSPIRDVCFLTVVPAPGHSLLGLIAPVPAGDWAALDARERAYSRQDARAAITHDLPHSPQIALYAIAPAHHHPPGPGNAILLSYLDVVVQGYLAEYGPEGVAHFFATTDGWQAPVLDDRAAPLYPRAQSLSAAERALVSAGLARVGARVTRNIGG